MGTEGARISLCTEFFPILLSSEGVFHGSVDSLAQGHFSGGKFTLYYWDTNILSIALVERSLKTEIYPCGGTYIYIDVPSEEALPPCPRFAKASLGSQKHPRSSLGLRALQ